jgi:hypothetical protein
VKQGLENVDELAQGLARNAIALKVLPARMVPRARAVRVQGVRAGTFHLDGVRSSCMSGGLWGVSVGGGLWGLAFSVHSFGFTPSGRKPKTLNPTP